MYVSNETPNLDVFFDNLQVTHLRGPLLEESHYYPFGLQMAGISTRAAGGVENRFRWNSGTELNRTFDIHLYETAFRSLDPQLGRFWQVDPRPTPAHSLYAAMANNPLLYTDPLGDTIINGQYIDDKEFMDPVFVTTKKKSSSVYGGGGCYWYGSDPSADMYDPLKDPFYIEWQNEQRTAFLAPVQAGFGFSEFTSSTELAIAALKPSFSAAASMAKHNVSDVPLWLKKNIFVDPLLKNNNAISLGRISASSARVGANILNVTAPALTVIAIGSTLHDIIKDQKLSAGDAFQGINTAMQYAFPVYGFLYGVVDLGFSIFSDQSLTDRIKYQIDSNITTTIRF